MNRFKVGDKVILTSSRHGSNLGNPVYSKYKVIGRIRVIKFSGNYSDINDLFIEVIWDNDRENSYHPKDLELIERKNEEHKLTKIFK